MLAEVHHSFVPSDIGWRRFGVFEIDISSQTETN